MGLKMSDFARPIWDVESFVASAEEGENGYIEPLTPRRALEGYVSQFCRTSCDSASEAELAEIRKNAEIIVDMYRSSIRYGTTSPWISPDLGCADRPWNPRQDEGLLQLVLGYLSVEYIAMLLFRRPEEIVARIVELGLVAE